MKKVVLVLAILSMSGCYATIHKPMKEVWCYQAVWKPGAEPGTQFAICENIDGEQVQVVIYNATK